MRDPLDEALGLPPMERPDPEIVVPERETSDVDYEFARESAYRLIAKGEMMLDELGDIARISQHPRAFETYSNLFKSVLDANRELLGLKKTHRDISGQRGGGGDGAVTNVTNQTLVMTSEEVLRLLKKKEE